MIIVTGGAGFIGSATVHELNRAGEREILIVDRLGNGTKWKNLVNLEFSDLIHKDAMPRLLESLSPSTVDGVIHMGACSSTLETDADYLIENNYRTTVQLAEWCISNRIKFVYASSAATYGNGAGGFDDDPERLPALRPLNPYGYSKHLFDCTARNRGWLNRITGLKFFNVYGPNEYHKGTMQSLVPRLHQAALENRPFQLFKSYRKEYGHGEQERDFIYIKDVTAIIKFFMDNPEQCGIYNAGTGTPATFNRLAAAVARAHGKPLQLEYIGMPEQLRNQYQYSTGAKTDRLRHAGCTRSFYTLEAGVEDYVRNYLLNQDPFLGNGSRPAI